MMILFSLTAIFFPYMWPVCCCLLPASPRSPPPPPLPHRHWGCTFFSSTLIMPTLNELLLLGSRPKQLLLCLFAHRKRELSPFKSHDIIHLTLFLSTLLPPNFLLFLSSNVVYSVLINFLITIYQIFSPLYTVYSNIHSNIICIAITGNKILCLMSYVLLHMIPWTFLHSLNVWKFGLWRTMSVCYVTLSQTPSGLNLLYAI